MRRSAAVTRASAVPVLLPDILSIAATRWADRPALRTGSKAVSYGDLWNVVEQTASGLLGLGLQNRERVAVYLPKTAEAVATCFGTALAGGVFVPINPVLRPAQVGHIVRDSGARVLVTSAGRLAALGSSPGEWPDLAILVIVDADAGIVAGSPTPALAWEQLIGAGYRSPHRSIDADLVALFYTSGSTGPPKGVMLSHRNMVAGAISVASYLGHDEQDRLLGILPLSFDAGFSQLTTGFIAGAEVNLLDYLLPGDVVRTVADSGITAITGVPPLWTQLAAAEWPAGAGDTLRYFASTGGVLPVPLLRRLQQIFPRAEPYLMYGLTEAFRSTYLPPGEVALRPDSIGKAIPNAGILVLREDGTACSPGEPGELVHRGALVSLGYWRDAELTSARFRPLPGAAAGGTPEIAVWSGDTVVADTDGYLYFKGRRDELIKSSGYRISPAEIEDVVMASGLVTEAVACGIPDARLGQIIAVVAVPRAADVTADRLLGHCRSMLPPYMVPARIIWRSELRRNANGKFDRPALRAEVEEELSRQEGADE